MTPRALPAPTEAEFQTAVVQLAQTCGWRVMHVRRSRVRGDQWATATSIAGREVGYLIDAVCDEDGCTEQIDRGLAYVCGGMHDGGEHGCGGYFCEAHLFVACPPDGRHGFLCARCVDKTPDVDDEED